MKTCFNNSPGSSAPISKNRQIGGFSLGCQAWTFKEYSVLEAIDKTAAAGCKLIEFYPGQQFSPDRPELKFDHNASEDMIEVVKARLLKRGVYAVNYGVVDIPNNEIEARKLFGFARQFELYGITTESVDAIDLIEKLVQEFDIRAGFHNHPRRQNDPGYKLWDPNYVLGLVKDRDLRVGSTPDVGHWLRTGLAPLDCLKILRTRVISVHLKDLNEEAPDAHDVPFGTGVCGMPGILEELKYQNCVGNLSIEYEHNWEDNVADVAQCVGFVRGLTAK